jgi:amidase
MTATELVRRIRRKEVSVCEVMEAHLAQIDRVNPRVNAIVTYLPEQAMDQARRADERLGRGEAGGPLFGLPVAHKDLVWTKGIRTTWGSPIFKDFVPDQDALIVERLKQAGAITVGKTNTPEFGAGSQTFNPVFGATLNPYDTARTCGGSSGGAAVALACGMMPIADGSDMGGSLRNPANYCNVVGFRTSPGRVPRWPALNAWGHLSVEGPMARTVEDAALLLSAMAGPDPRAPIAISEPGAVFRKPLERDFRGVRIAWSRDFGELPVDPRVTAALDAKRQVFEDLGCVVEDGQPAFTEADEVFKVLRAWSFAATYQDLFKTHRDRMKDTVVWNIEAGLALTGAQVGAAEVKRTTLYHRIRTFMETYEFMLFPVSQVPPFDVSQPYITEINGVAMATYIDWMKSCYYISVTGLPALSVPCGFTPEGLPVGLQIVGRHQDEFGVLQLAHAFEQATGVWKRRPGVAG